MHFYINLITNYFHYRWSCKIGKPANIFLSKEGLVIVGDSDSQTLVVPSFERNIWHFNTANTSAIKTRVFQTGN